MLSSALLLLTALSVQRAAPAQALDNGLARTPQMGWNSWNRFGCTITESDIRAQTDAIVSSGLNTAGYQYVTIDDCWQAGSRDSSGQLVADPTRFPSGIKSLADHVHAAGLKLGIYATPGSRTCGEIYNGYPGAMGSLGHEQADAQTFASWGVDYLKYDWCRADQDGASASTAFAKMRDALNATGRPILFSIHDEPELPVPSWRASTANSWRTTGDISDNWNSMIGIAHTNQPLASYAGPGAWNDPDMLEVGNGGMTDSEYWTHFALWAEMAAPLIMGNDLRTMSPATRQILTNTDAIAVGQDPLGRQGTVVSSSGGLVVMSKPLADGDRAVTLTNETGSTATISTTGSAVGVGGASSYTLKNLWTKAVTTTSGTISTDVGSHDTVMYLVTPVGLVTGRVISGLDGSVCMDDNAGSGDNGTKVQTWACNNTPAQNWTFAADGTVRINGKCLDAVGSGTANGTLIQLWDCYGGGNQTWSRQNGTLVNPVSGRCLDIPGFTTANGTQLDIWDCNGGANQKWTIP